jgi:hypothetical protein
MINEYPKWVSPHPSWVEVLPDGNELTPDYPPPNSIGWAHPGGPSGDVSEDSWVVIVSSAEEEARVLGPRVPRFPHSLAD